MKYAVIGGSVLSQLDSHQQTQAEVLSTPYGASAAMQTLGIGDHEIIYFNRHGKHHTIAPHQINYRANLFALKQLEVTHVIASAAVGGISTDMPPLQLVIPDQLIDYSYGREHSYNDLNIDSNAKQVNHIDFSYPFDEALRQQLVSTADKLEITCRTTATYGVTQGPRLETAAEIQRMQQDGCHIVGMTAMPEAALARELDIAYASCAIVVNWAAGKAEQGQVVSMQEIVSNIQRADICLQALMTEFFSALMKKVQL